MSDFILRRTASNPKGTLGYLVKDGTTLCVTCEEPWKNNARRESCIPAGRYKVVKRVSPKFGHHWLVMGVPSRSLILIHTGNTIKDTEGCILVGKEFSVIDGLPAVTESRATMEALRAKLPDQFWLTVIDWTPQ